VKGRYRPTTQTCVHTAVFTSDRITGQTKANFMVLEPKLKMETEKAVHHNSASVLCSADAVTKSRPGH
jgi:hypothetical protein